MGAKFKVSRRIKHDDLISILLENLSHRKVGRSILQYWVKGDHKRIFDVELNPNGYSCHHDFAHDYLATQLLRKYPDLQLGVLS